MFYIYMSCTLFVREILMALNFTFSFYVSLDLLKCATDYYGQHLKFLIDLEFERKTNLEAE